MEQHHIDPGTEQTNQRAVISPLHQVTPLSKYLAMALFVLLPFLGGYIGYSFAPVKVVEKEVVREVVVEQEVEVLKVEDDTQSSQLFEVWHLKTSFDSEFLSQPNDSYLQGSYELLAKYELAGFDYELYDTKKANLNPNVFYAVATKKDENILVRINTQNQSFEELVTLESEKTSNAASIVLGGDDQGVIFFFPSCTQCTPIVLDEAVYLINQNDYHTIGTTSKFEWIEGGYRYKSIPDGCDATFNAAYEPTPSELCEQKVEALDWVVYTP